jgi:NADH-quinone oxidoreductase subunit M
VVLITLAVIGIIYGALVAMVQPDVKRLVAYSSVSHMGFVVLGLFSFTKLGMQGALYQMLNHGVSTGALFLFVGFIYERRHTRQISDFGGLATPMPWLRDAVLYRVAVVHRSAVPERVRWRVSDPDSERGRRAVTHTWIVTMLAAPVSSGRRFTCCGCCSACCLASDESGKCRPSRSEPARARFALPLLH